MWPRGETTSTDFDADPQRHRSASRAQGEAYEMLDGFGPVGAA
jgi:hypothetical protein